MNIRTDLAIERQEMSDFSCPEGIKIRDFSNDDCTATVIDIISEAGEKALRKPRGRYITLVMESFPDSHTICDGRIDMLCEMLTPLIPSEGTVLVAGLGNTDITPDSVGPLCADRIIATRHIGKDDLNEPDLPSLRPVAVIRPGVTGKTGIETVEIIAGVKEKIKPAAIIIIDALASRSIERLGTTVQICNTGIEPGSGVNNRRKAIDEKTMGIPVIAIGIPTVVDVATLSYDLTGKEVTDSNYKNMMVTPKDTDIMTSGGANLIALALNICLQKNLTREEIISLSIP